MNTIQPKEVASRSKEEELLIIDVRSKNEFAYGHIPGATNIPLEDLEEHKEELAGKEIVFVCRSGMRSSTACKSLDAYKGIQGQSLEGGMMAWEKEKLPVEKTKNGIPIIRQVMLVAGGLVLIGVLLSIYVHVYWVGLSAFVGLGLMYAGASGNCMMAAILGKMPWNK